MPLAATHPRSAHRFSRRGCGAHALALAAVCAATGGADIQREAAAALVGIRRGLYPDAAGYLHGAPDRINRMTEATQ